MLALAYPPARLVVPAFVGLVPLLVFIAERPAGPAGRWAATQAGVLTGLVYFGLQLYWIAAALAPHSLLGVPAWALTVALLAGFLGAFSWALHYTMHRLDLPLALLAPLLWTTLEWTQGRLGAFSFPWLGLGHALTPYPVLAGAADLVGGRGLTLWVAGVNALLATALLRYRAGRSSSVPHLRPGPAAAAPLVAAVLLAAAPMTYGYWRAVTIEMVPVATVAVVQPNIPQSLRIHAAPALDTSWTALARLTTSSASQAPDLVAWPEVALLADLTAQPELANALADLSSQTGAPILVGAYGSSQSGPDTKRRLFNSAFLAREAGLDETRYDKRRLVPFVERVPLWPTGGRFGGLEHGRTQPLFLTGGHNPSTFGVLICYEAIFPNLARSYRKNGARFLVNITNDGWFGSDAWYGRTSALWQHPAHLTMRAIENRMGAARAANTGISMFVDPLGNTRQATTVFVQDLRVDTILTTNESTLFTRWGDWLATLAAITSLALVLAARRNHHPAS